MKRGVKPQNKPSHLTIIDKKPAQPPSVKADPVSSKAWNQVVGLLEAQGNLSQADSRLIELFSTTYAHWLRMTDELRTMPLTTPDGEPNAAFWKATNAVRGYGQLLDRYLDQLSLTPSRRGKADPSTKDDAAKYWDGLI